MTSLFASHLWLAPMAGITDRAFRHLCVEHGAKVTVSEMVSAKGLQYDGFHTWELIERADNEEKLVVQLFGSEPACIAAQAARVRERMGSALAGIDVNMGCPVSKVVKKGEGSALMRSPELAADIIRALVDSVDVPVSAKFRSGWTREEENAPAFAQALEHAGAAYVTVHGRSARQMYRGESDPTVIAKVKAAVGIPVVGSGDVYSAADAEMLMISTGCDAVMVARGARGNPWIFEDVVPSERERIEAAREHMRLFVHYEGGDHLTPLRAQLPWYLRGIPHASDLRRDLSAASSAEDFEAVFSACLERL